MSAVLRGLAAVVEDVELARELYREGFYGRFLGYDKVRREEVNKVNAPLIWRSMRRCIFLRGVG